MVVTAVYKKLVAEKKAVMAAYMAVLKVVYMVVKLGVVAVVLLWKVVCTEVKSAVEKEETEAYKVAKKELQTELMA